MPRKEKKQARSSPGNNLGPEENKGTVPELEEFSQESPPLEEPETTVLPEQKEFYKVPRRFGSIPVDELPLGCDREKQYYVIYPRISLPFQRVERISFGHPEFEPNRLFFGDNLHVMRMLPSNSIDLIYIDPPFFSGKQYNIIFGDANEVRSFSDIWEGGMPGYLTWMNARLLEMKRLLKPDGTIYVHLDQHAVHYVKVEMDKIFGYDAFRNEIVWWYRRWPSTAPLFQKDHDTVLVYDKGKARVWNQPYQALSAATLKRFKGKQVRGETTKEVLENNSPGAPMHDVWNDINHVLGANPERIGYPTQKPEGLLDRIISASSNKGGVVADFFCGGGTTPAVAQRLNRRWIACDNSRIAVAITADRLTKQVMKPEGGSKTVQHLITPTPDISVEHWGIYEVPSLTKLSNVEFRQFVIAAYNGRLASTDDAVHGYKDGVPLYVGPASQDEKVTKDAVLDFAKALVTKKGKNRGTMLAWSFADSAVKASQRIEAESSVTVDLVKIALVQIESHEFRSHIVSRHKEYADLLAFILPPEVRISHKRVGPKTYEFDISESASMNPGGKVMNVQWDFDFEGRFASTRGYSFIRGDKGNPTLTVTYEFPGAGKWKVACKVQDDRGGEKTEVFDMSVS